MDTNEDTHKTKHYRTKQESLEILQKMQKALINGERIKVAILDAGFSLSEGMHFFKSKTGKTMKQFQQEHRPPY